MKPKRNAKKLLGITRSQAKMYEYSIPKEAHIDISFAKPSELYSLTIGLIGDLSYYVIEENTEKIELTKKKLQFSAHFFDAFLQSKLREEDDDYLKLIGSASYYLCDLPGSSKVLLESLNYLQLDLDCETIDKALYSVINNKILLLDEESRYVFSLNKILNMYQVFFNTGDIGNLFELINTLRENIYSNGTDRELLFIDILYAVIKIKYKNSSWVSLPKYSGLKTEIWDETIRKEGFIQELWPAQHLLGEKNIYKGTSAVVQMPTSAGKTKSIELIIRSAFLSERANLAIIVAPFRALCNEIKNDITIAFSGEDIEVNEFSDVMQIDEADNILEILDLNETNKTILISTPEKLYFILKQFPHLAANIDLLIYDEGHQFDSGKRGVTYELLLASLKTLVSDHVQTILISAVIGNAEEINEWLNPEKGIVVEGSTLTPTYRTVGFTSWSDTLGQVKFINPMNPDKEEFFVPRVIESQELELNPREFKRRAFPDKNNVNSIALFLGLKLSNQGSVAIFSGTKTSVVSMCDYIVNSYSRNLAIDKPISYSDEKEITKLITLYKMNLGNNNEQSKAVELGILTHHGNLPQGLKLSVEYALQQSLAKFVICTSTLAQGVNLPIRYLIITSVYQAGTRLKVRDFHNLIGRAGRSGKYTEGSIIFANNELYDMKNNTQRRKGGSGKWKWDGVKELLNPLNSEDSSSSILTIFDNIINAKGKKIYDVNLDFILALLNSPEIENVPAIIKQQLISKKAILNSIESYILTNFDKHTDLTSIVENTLAYHSSDDSKQAEIIQLFEAVQKNILDKVPQNKRIVYSKSLFGIDDIKLLEEWLSENLSNLLEAKTEEHLFLILWDVIAENISNETYLKYALNEPVLNIISEWIEGKAYYEIFENLKSKNIKLGNRKLTIEHIITICEQALSFEGTMILSSLIELLELQEESNEKDNLQDSLKFLQKQIKYGLKQSNEIIIYELGFCDRIIAQELAQVLCDSNNCSFERIKNRMRRKSDLMEEILIKFPSYFTKVHQNL